MITIYEGMAKLTQFKTFVLRDVDTDAGNSYYLTSLVGINVSGDVIEPVYKARLTVQHRGGILGLQFPRTMVVFMRRRPWVVIQTTKKEVLKRL